MSNRKSKSRRIPVGFSDFEDDPSSLHVVGNPFGGGSPTMREATLEDCVDECEMCQAMRRQILAGNPPRIMAFE